MQHSCDVIVRKFETVGKDRMQDELFTQSILRRNYHGVVFYRYPVRRHRLLTLVFACERRQVTGGWLPDRRAPVFEDVAIGAFARHSVVALKAKYRSSCAELCG